MQKLYQQAYDSARVAYEESNSKLNNVVQFKEECAVNKVPEISRADYNTILLHAEKISNGQHDFAPVLRRELHEKLNIADAESLISDLMTNSDIEILNRVRLSYHNFLLLLWETKGHIISSLNTATFVSWT